MGIHQPQSNLSAVGSVDVSLENPLPGKTAQSAPIIVRAEHSGSAHRSGLERQYDRAGIGVIISGLIEYRAQTGTVTGVPGTVFFGNVDECYRASRLSGNGLRRLVIWYDGAILDEIANAFGLGDARFPVVALSPGKNAASIFARMQALALGLSDLWEAGAALAATGLTLGEEKRSNLAVSSLDRRRILSVVAYVEQSFSQPCAIDTLAAMSGLSRFHFMRLFKAVTGLSPNQYVINLRLRAAATRITETKAPISEIALTCGFNDISHFNTCFRAMFECTPRQMRG